MSGGYVTKLRGEMHTMWNVVAVPARMIEVMSPAGFELLRRLAELPESDSPDLSEIARSA